MYLKNEKSKTIKISVHYFKDNLIAKQYHDYEISSGVLQHSYGIDITHLDRVVEIVIGMKLEMNAGRQTFNGGILFVQFIFSTICLTVSGEFTLLNASHTA